MCNVYILLTRTRASARSEGTEETPQLKQHIQNIPSIPNRCQISYKAPLSRRFFLLFFWELRGCRVSPRRATYFSCFAKKSRQKKASPLLTTLRLRCGQPDSGISTGARQNSTSSPRALRSDNCRESDVEVLIGTCRSKPPVESPESGVIRRARAGAGNDTARCFARARFPPHPSPLPQAGEGARPKTARSTESATNRAQQSMHRRSQKSAQKLAHHISRSREINRHERSDVP